jgi:RNA polymerase sigma-70 factor, ECF subfamily
VKLSRKKFEALALEQLDTLYRVARRLSGNAAAAEDLVQETYLRAIRAWESFNLKEHGIRPWLVRIMHNLFLSRRQRQAMEPGPAADEQLESGAGANQPPPFDLASFDGMDEHLVRAIEALSPEYQLVLLLWAVEELSYKEIAEALQIPLGTVMSRLYRARQQLSARLRDYAIREGIIRE